MAAHRAAERRGCSRRSKGSVPERRAYQSFKAALYSTRNHDQGEQNLKNQQKHMSDTRSKPTQHEIEVCAYCIWEQEGRPAGRALNHWLQAELQLVVESIWNGGATEQDRESPQTAKTSSNACPPNRASDFCGLPLSSSASAKIPVRRELMSGFKMQRLGLVMGPELGNPLDLRPKAS